MDQGSSCAVEADTEVPTRTTDFVVVVVWCIIYDGFTKSEIVT